MKTQLLAGIALGALSIAMLSSTTFAFQGDLKGTVKDDPKAAAPTTEDVVYMRDGRVLHGQILSQTSKFIVFEYQDAALKMKTKMNLQIEDIAEIQRDQPLMTLPASTNEPKPEEDTGTANAAGSGKKTDYKPSYGASRFQTSEQGVPSLYIVPMHGQFGTDVRSDVYKPVIEDIRKNKPTAIIIDIKSADSVPWDVMFPGGYDIGKVDPRRNRSLLEFEEYRELVHMFRDDLHDIPQYVWIHDSDGISATVSMAWDKIYLTPDSRFGGMITVLDQSGADKWQDKDVRAKMTAAWLGMAKSFAEKGGYSQVLVDAMLQPEKVLSGSWEGRKINWQLNADGEYVVDASDKRTADFIAKSAEDLCISQGTAEDLDDLALLLGYREYRVIDSKQDDLTVGYVQDWRRSFANCEQWLKDYQKHMGWASGEDAIKYLGRAKKNLEDVLGAMDRYKAVEIRLGRDYGLDRVTLITYIEKIKETLRALQKRNTGGTGGGRTGGGSGSGMGGG